MLIGIAIALLALLFSNNNPMLTTVASLGLAIEILGGALFLVSFIARSARGMKFGDRAGAQTLEQDFGGYEQIVAWLRSFPREHLESRLVFASNRADSMQRTLPFVMGGIERLGMLPVFIALYFQFKDVQSIWALETTAVGGILALGTVALYGLGLWAVTRRLQVTRFERFLKVALDPRFKLVAAGGHP